MGVSGAVKKEAIPPPDGGWGWVVVFASFMIHVIADGVTYTFGIFFVEIVHYYHEGKGATSWIASILVGITLGSGPIASCLTNKYGCRAVTIAGAFLAFLGFALSIFAPDVVTLYFTIGVCGGLGFGLMYLPAIVCVTCYFEKKRSFATGVAVCGSGLGTFAFAPLTEYLVENYGWKGAMLIISAIILHCAFFGALFRPLEPKRRSKKHKKDAKEIELLNVKYKVNDKKLSIDEGALDDDNNPISNPVSNEDYKIVARANSDLNVNSNKYDAGKQEEDNKSGYDSDKEDDSAPKFLPTYGSVISLNIHKSNPNMYNEINHISPSNEEGGGGLCCSPNAKKEFKEMMDLTLLLDVIFLLMCISNFCTSIGFNVPYVYIKDRALDLGMSSEKSSFLISIIGIANTISRLVLGYISDNPRINRLYLYNTVLTICGLATVFSAYAYDYTSQGVYAAVFGATSGAYVGLTSVVLVDLMGLEKITNAFGLLLLFQGVASLIGPPIAGWLYDGLQSYDPGFYVAGTMIAISGSMLFSIPFVRRCLERRQLKNGNYEPAVTA